MTTLIIVESPAKCSKIASFLGPGYEVMASMGHVRKLMEDLKAVGIDRDFEPIYVAMETKAAAIAKLKKAARSASRVMLASDDDPEGEAIAFHVCFLLGLPVATTPRIVFHEITPEVVRAAVAAPRRIDMNRVYSQQTRAMLDLLIGFSVSGLLWGFGRGLSAGRCQTPALRLLCDKEEEIAGFKSKSTFPFEGTWQTAAKTKFESTLIAPEAAMATYEAATGLAEQIAANVKIGTVSKLTNTPSSSVAPEPFITATLQQVASSRLGMSPAATMRAAQKLYEGGHITYMRTDSTALSADAVAAAAAWITENHGAEYSVPRGGAAAATPPKSTKTTKKGKAAAAAAAGPVHAAHEAIRPTHLEVTDIDGDRLYALIWRRTMQSQMADSRSTVKRMQITTPKPCETTWTASWERLDFPGWRILDPAAAGLTDDGEETGDVATGYAASNAAFAAVAKLAVGDKLTFVDATVTEKPSQPTARYTEASLISELKKRGIGRPSTFAHILESVLDRGYAVKETRPGVPTTIRSIIVQPGATIRQTSAKKAMGAQTNKLFVTPIGTKVATYLTERFLNVFDYDYTSTMNGYLDSVARGETEWKEVLRTAWEDLEPRIIEARGAAAAATKEARAAEKDARARGELPPDTETRRWLDTDVKVVVTKFGPRFAIAETHEWFAEGKGEAPTATKPKDRFFQLPEGVTFKKATLEDAEAAVAAAAEAAAAEAAEDGPLGSYNGHAIVLKKGPFGWYLQAGDVKSPAPDGEATTAEDAVAAITAKATAYRRDLSDVISVRQGPKGSYYIMKTVGKGKPVFKKLPDGANHETITLEECVAVLAAPAGRAAPGKRPAPKKDTKDTKDKKK